MNLLTLQRKYNTQAKCLIHLQKVRWSGKPVCPYCKETERIYERTKEYRYHCNYCNNDFSVLVDTIFEDTKIELPIWFYMIALMCNAPMGISSKELSRDLGLPYKTAWYMAMRIRCGMLDQADMLEGIIEMDEAYIGGKPRKKNTHFPDNMAVLSKVFEKRGRGTRKVPVVGAVSRGKAGQVTTKVIEKLTTKNLLAMLRRYVRTKDSIVITDEFRSYNAFNKAVEHMTIDHTKAFVQGSIHTNTIEGFWSIVKDGLRGNYNAVSKKYLPFYMAEFSFKYNRRNRRGESFKEFLGNALTEEKCMTKYKPKKDVKKLAYGRRKKRK